MKFKDFIIYIESVGFKDSGSNCYEYKNYKINFYIQFYNFYNGSEWIRNIDYNDLTPLKKITRSIKLKELLKNDQG